MFLGDVFHVTQQSFLLDWAELQEVSGKDDNWHATKVPIKKPTEVPQLLVDLVKRVEAKHANLVYDQYLPTPPPLLPSFVADLRHVFLYLSVSVSPMVEWIVLPPSRMWP